MPAEQNETPLVGGLAGVERTGQPDRIHALQNSRCLQEGMGLGYMAATPRMPRGMACGQTTATVEETLVCVLKRRRGDGADPEISRCWMHFPR